MSTPQVLQSNTSIVKVIPNFYMDYSRLVNVLTSNIPLTLKSITHYFSSSTYSNPSYLNKKNIQFLTSLNNYMVAVKKILDANNITYKVRTVSINKGLFKKTIPLLYNLSDKPIGRIATDLVTETKSVINVEVKKPNIDLVEEEKQQGKEVSNVVVLDLDKQVNNTLSSVISLLKKFNNGIPEEDFDLFVHTYLYKLRLSAKLRNIPFTLTYSALKKLLKTKKCYFLGIELTPDNFTIDRLECDEGYTNKNCVAASQLANNFKNYTIEAHNIPSIFFERILMARTKGLMIEPEEASFKRDRKRT